MAPESNPSSAVWTARLSDEDLAFLKRFLLASGSLKALAESYGVSYPTIRLRLDRLIQKVQLFDEAQQLGEFELTLRGLLADGRIDAAAMRALADAHRNEMEKEDSR